MNDHILVKIEVPFITGFEPFELSTLEESIVRFRKFVPNKEPIILIPPELKFKAKEFLQNISQNNSTKQITFAVIYTFASQTAWCVADKSLIEPNFNN